MEEHLSTDASDPISVIKDYIRSHLSDPELAAPPSPRKST